MESHDACAKKTKSRALKLATINSTMMDQYDDAISRQRLPFVSKWQPVSND